MVGREETQPTMVQHAGVHEEVFDNDDDDDDRYNVDFEGIAMWLTMLMMMKIFNGW